LQGARDRIERPEVLADRQLEKDLKESFEDDEH